jgi:PAS domain S-box-containing protein
MTTFSAPATAGPDVGVVQFDGVVLDRRYAEMIAESIPHIVWTASPDGATTYFNQQGTDYTGCPRETNYEWNWVTLVHPEDAERAAQAWRHAVMTGTEYCLEYRIRRFDGVFRWHSFRAIPLRDAAGEIELWIGTATDIEDQKQLELALRRAEREAQETVTLLESIEVATPVGFKLVDRGLRVVRINQMLADVEGRSIAECIGRTVAEFVPDLWPTLENVYRRVLAGETVSNVDVSKPSAADPHRMRHWLASYYPVRIDGEIVGVGNVVVDITERREAEEFRAVVMDNMAEGLYTLDADGFVTYLNPAAASMLGWTEDELRGKSMHAAVHFQRADGTTIPTEACSLLQVRTQGRSIRNLDDAFTRKDGSIFPVAYSSAPLQSGATLQGVVVVFRDITEEKKEQAAAQRALDALTWVGRIRDAIDENRLVLYSQAIVPLAGGQPSEELLLRMIGRDNEVILPGSFLPVAEKYGLIGEIDRWVITQATRLAATGRRVIEANLSAASIGTSDLLPFIEQQIRDAHADPANLVFEITETALMQDITAGEAFARGLATLGCGVALDDFGTGFGSFTYLKKLPITHLKIDIEFVRDLVTHPDNLHVVKAIVSLARAFSLKTIAEGVEDEQTLILLRAEGVDFAQGFHLGIPGPISDSGGPSAGQSSGRGGSCLSSTAVVPPGCRRSVSAATAAGRVRPAAREDVA